MPDNNLRIGATFDKGQLEAGFTSVQDLTQKVTERLAVSFEEASSRSRTAMKNLSDGVKVAAENISDETLRIADATRAQSAAYADLARARIIAKDTKIAPEVSTPILGAAQEQYIKSSQELAAAKQAEANAVVAAGEREALAGQKVTAEALRTAAAVRQQSAAQAELARVQALVANGSLQDAEADQILAAATVRLAGSSKEVIAAKRAEAEAVAKASEEEALSQNVVLRAFQRMAIGVREATEGVQERMFATAEAAEVSADGIAAGFGGLGKLFGAGIAVDFAAHFLDDVAKVNVELGDLYDKTNINVKSLAGLKQIAREMGLPFENMETALVRMERAQVEAVEGHKQQRQAFDDLGVTMREVETLSPEQMLYRLSTAMKENTSQAVRDASALEIFGRGGKDMIPILQEQGSALEANAKKKGENTGYTEKSVAAARQWTAAMADLSAELHSYALPVLEHIIPVMRSIGLVFEAAAAVVVSSVQAMVSSLIALFSGLKGLALIFKDAMTGNFSAMVSDAIGAKDALVNAWTYGFQQIKNNFAAVRSEAANIHWDPPPIEHHEQTGPTNLSTLDAARMKTWQQQLSDLRQQHKVTVQEEIDFWKKRIAETVKGSALYEEINTRLGNLAGKGGKGAGGEHAALHRDEDQLNAIKLDHQVTLEEEIRFWQEKLATARKGSQEYRDIVGKLAPLTQREDRAKKPELKPEEPTETGEFKNYVQQWEQQQTAMLRFDEESYKQDIEAMRAATDEKMRIAQGDARNAIEDAQHALSEKKITRQQEVQLEISASNQEYIAELQAVRFKELLDMGEAQAYQRDLNRELEMTRQHARQIAVLNRQSAEQSGAAWKQAFQKMQEDMNTVLMSMIEGHQKLAQQLATVWNGIVQNFAKNVLMMTEQFLIGVLIQKAGQKSVILGDAKTAAANTYASVSAIPAVGPFLAPAAAAVAFAAVLAFDSFNEGGMVTKGGGMHVPILAKAGERVLSTSQTDNFHSLVNNSSRGGSSITNHLHYEPQINAYDRSGFRNQLRGHSDDIADLMRSVLRPEAFA